MSLTDIFLIQFNIRVLVLTWLLSNRQYTITIYTVYLPTVTVYFKMLYHMDKDIVDKRRLCCKGRFSYKNSESSIYCCMLPCSDPCFVHYALLNRFKHVRSLHKLTCTVCCHFPIHVLFTMLY